MYYLQSRYYDPAICRFINADSYASTGQGIIGCNMYAYCGNCPTTFKDSGGNSYADALDFRVDLQDGAGAGLIGGGGATIAIVEAIEDTRDKIKAYIESLPNISKTRNHSVYILTDPYNADLVKYVGRTVNPQARAYQHRHDPRHPERRYYNMTVVATNLTIDEARLAEQTLIALYSLAYLDNMRNEIAAGKIASFELYWDAVKEILIGAGELDMYDLFGGI